MIRRRLAGESGITLIELLVAMSISLIVFAATMTFVVTMLRGADRNEHASEAQDTARVYSDRLARQLRNLASPSIFTDPSDPDAALRQKPEAVDVAGPYDFVFRTIDDLRPGGSLNQANVKRVRYCVDDSHPDDEVLWEQDQIWTSRTSYDPPDTPDTSACPGTGWTTSRRVVSSLVNRIGAQDRPAFLYNDSDPRRVTEVRTQLYVDTTPGSAPPETRLVSGVTLRNQNRAPTAAFTLSVLKPGSLLLNGSDSQDPEGMALKYYWYVDPPTPLPDCTSTPEPPSCLTAEGVVVNANAASGHKVALLVKDPAGLAASASATVP